MIGTKMYPNNLGAFLTMIKISELGRELILNSDGGYNVLVGSTASRPLLFSSYADHPRRLVAFKDKRGNTFKSSAAGAYQILARYYDAYKLTLKLKDFSPASQDAIAIKMIKEQGAYNHILRGEFTEAVVKVKNIWASLPGAGYGQNEHPFDHIRTAFINAGGKVVS